VGKFVATNFPIFGPGGKPKHSIKFPDEMGKFTAVNLPTS